MGNLSAPLDRSLKGQGHIYILSGGRRSVSIGILDVT